MVAGMLLAGGCATNPVTGRSELQLIPESQEIAMGVEQFPWQQQIAGGRYTIDPDLEAYVREVGRKLAAVADRSHLPYEFAIVNEGSWNAWALPGGKVAIHRGLLEALRNESELAAVLSHEIVHAAARHSAQQMERGLWMEMGMAGASGLAGDEYRDLVRTVGGVAAGLGLLKYSRAAESESDHYGMLYMVKAGYDATGAVTLQELFAEHEGSAGGWLASHPASIERVRRNRETLQQNGASGYVGEAEYRVRTRRLRERAPAYALYEKGLKALEDQNAEEAYRLAEQARLRLPEEAQFSGLKARALQSMGRNRDALEAWNEALRRQPGWFYYWLQRGLLQEKLGDKARAKADLEQSRRLLPTEAAEAGLRRVGGG